MATVTTPSVSNPFHKAFHDLVRDKGRNVFVGEFLKGEVLTAGVMISHGAERVGGMAAHELGIERAMLNVARECPRACSGCNAMEVIGRRESSHANHEDRITVSARCTSAGYCPRATIPVTLGMEDFGHEFMTAASSAGWVAEMRDLANNVMAERRHIKPAEKPSNAPKTKAPLIW